MRIACSSITFDPLIRANLMTLGDVLKVVKGFGIDAVELQYEHMPSVSPSYINELQTSIEGEKVSIAALSLNNRFGFPNEDVRERELERITKAAEVAKAIGAKVIKLSTGEGSPMDKSYELHKRWVADSLIRVAEVVERMGLPIAVENDEGMCAYPEELLWLIDEINSPYVGVCFNALNLIRCGLSGDSLYEAVELLAPFTMHSHAMFTEFDDEGNDSVIDYGRLIRIFADAEYEGFHSIVDPSEKPFERLPLAVALLNRSIKGAIQM